MGFRFRKQFTIFPGVKINLSKSGVSTSLGGHGATVNVGSSGKRTMTLGIPGTGLSYQLPLGIGAVVFIFISPRCWACSISSSRCRSKPCCIGGSQRFSNHARRCR